MIDSMQVMRCSVWALALAACVGPGRAATPTGTPTAVRAAPAPAAKETAPVDINGASRAQLKTLPGIGDVEADRIISGRPYHSKADLAERGVIPTGVYLSLKNQLIAKQKSKGKVGVP